MCVPVWFVEQEPAFPLTDQRIISLHRGAQFVTTAGVRPAPIFSAQARNTRTTQRKQKTRRPQSHKFHVCEGRRSHKMHVLIRNRNPDMADMAMADMAGVIN